MLKDQRKAITVPLCKEKGSRHDFGCCKGNDLANFTMKDALKNFTWEDDENYGSRSNQQGLIGKGGVFGPDHCIDSYG